MKEISSSNFVENSNFVPLKSCFPVPTTTEDYNASDFSLQVLSYSYNTGEILGLSVLLLQEGV